MFLESHSVAMLYATRGLNGGEFAACGCKAGPVLVIFREVCACVRRRPVVLAWKGRDARTGD